MPNMSESLFHDLREVLSKVPLHCRTYLCRNVCSDALGSADTQGTAIENAR
jgi:hypothetical protein